MKQYQSPPQRKKYKILFPKMKLGLPNREKPYVLKESENGYSCSINAQEWIGFPKSVIETNPHLYTLIIK